MKNLIILIFCICIIGIMSCKNESKNEVIKTVLIDKTIIRKYDQVTHTIHYNKKVKLKKETNELWVTDEKLYNDRNVGDTILIIKKGFRCDYELLNKY